MIKVTVCNIDNTYVGIFDEADAQKAIDKALADLIKNQGFFEDNVFVGRFIEGMPETFRGIIALAEDVEYGDLWRFDETYKIYVEPYELGSMIDAG